MKTTKEKADELVDKFYNTYESLGLKYRLYREDCVHSAITSVKHTIEVLEKENDISYTTLDHVISEQTDVLTELESRL